MSKNIMADSASGFQISKKAGYLLAILSVASLVVVGLLVYYVGVAQFECDGSGLAGPESGSQSGAKKTKVTDVRLPSHLKPLKYKVDLIPFIIHNNFTIRGQVHIVMEAARSGDKNVTLHSAETSIDHSTVRVDEVDDDFVVVREIPTSSHEYDEDREFYITHLKKPLVASKKYKISMKFTAKLNDNLKGFYRSVYEDQKTGKDEYIAVTQFQSTDARRAFPCFDEPSLKAKFEVSLGRLKDMSSISNMPIKPGGQGVPMSDNSEYVWDHYEESVQMSTYLVAFVVSRFGYEESPEVNNNVTFRIWARKDALDQIGYAKGIGHKMLSHFEDYFGVQYPLPKQDMIAIPDFGAGAMENWGLITYRETALLFKDGVSAKSDKQRIATVISHELAHQWFGNLVTPSWWTDLWLNEGFASYVEYLGVEATQPELKTLEQFVLRELQSVFRIDALASSHPISIPVKHPDEINEIFDRISYAKGASIIRMMNKFLTEETFRRGLQTYLTKFSYKAAEQDDLWEQLTQQAHADDVLPPDVTVKMIMDTWTLQMGFPVVTVTRDYDGFGAELMQERFLLSKPDSKDKHDYKWWIPITYAVPGSDFSNTYSQTWMSNKTSSLTIKIVSNPDDPVIFNVQQTGYYRVNYDEKNWGLIIKQLNKDHTKIHVINRAQIIDDALGLARAGLLDYELALGVTSYLDKETEYIPWSAAISNLRYLDVMLERSSAYGEFKKYMRSLIDPLYKQLGFDEKSDDKLLDIYLRSIAVSSACGYGHEDCIKRATGQFREWMDKQDPDLEENNPTNVNMKRSVYCNAIKHGDETEWNFAWERYKGSNVATEKSSLLFSMACSRQIWLLNRYLNMSLTDGSEVRKADGRTVISSIASNIVGRDLAFDFIRENWATVIDYYGSASFALSGLMKNVLKDRNTPLSVNEIKEFQMKNQDSLTTARREVQQAVESGESNLLWMDRNYEKIHSWLKNRN